jgi:hypothetical protein
VSEQQDAQQLADDDAMRAFARKLIARAKLLNRKSGMGLAQSIWAHHRTRDIEITWTAEMVGQFPYFGLSSLVGVTTKTDIMNLVISGDLETAYVVLACASPDPMNKAYHCINGDFLYWLRHEIGLYLGWES